MGDGIVVWRPIMVATSKSLPEVFALLKTWALIIWRITKRLIDFFCNLVQAIVAYDSKFTSISYHCINYSCITLGTFHFIIIAHLDCNYNHNIGTLDMRVPIV